MTLPEQITQFNRMFKSYDDIYRQAAHRFRLPELSLWILYVLREIPDCTQKDLTDILLYSKQSVQSALRRLQDEELVVLRTDPADRRSKRIQITQKGEKISRDTADRIVQAEKTAFGQLSSDEREQLLCLFEKLSSAVRTEMEKLQR